jgi:hypothetical protein
MQLEDIKRLNETEQIKKQLEIEQTQDVLCRELNRQVKIKTSTPSKQTNELLKRLIMMITKH